MLIILSGHIHGNALSPYMPASLTYTSMAEVFIFLSGYVGGISFRRVRDRRGLGICLLKSFYRTAVVYLSHIATSAMMLAVFGIWSTYSPSDASATPAFLEFTKDKTQFTAGIVTLTQNVAGFEILPVYILLLLTLPWILVFERRRPLLWPLLSLAIYLFADALQASLLPRWIWPLNPFAWQLLFSLGVLLSGQRQRQVQQITLRWPAIVVAIAILELLFFGKLLVDDQIPLTGRENLGAVRLLHFTCLVVVGRALLKFWDASRTRAAAPVALCGRNALVSYCAGSVIASILSLAAFHFQYPRGWSFIANAAGWLGCMGCAWLAERTRGRRTVIPQPPNSHHRGQMHARTA